MLQTIPQLTHATAALLTLPAVPGGLSKEQLQEMRELGDDWAAQCNVTVKGMRACAWCGRAGFACKADTLYTGMRSRQSSTTPCAAAANSAAKQMAQVDLGQGHWWACAACNSKGISGAKRRSRQARLHPALGEDEVLLIRELLELPAGEALQLSVLKCGLRLVHRAFGYWTAQPLSKTALLSGPMAAFDSDTGTWEPTNSMPPC